MEEYLQFLQPTGLRLGLHSGTFADLSWDSPTSLPDNIVIDFYTVLCFQPEFEQHIEKAFTNGPEAKIRLSGLEMGTLYECDVRASLTNWRKKGTVGFSILFSPQAETYVGPTGWSEHLRFQFTQLWNYQTFNLIHIIRRFYPLPSAFRKFRSDNEELTKKVSPSFS